MGFESPELSLENLPDTVRLLQDELAQTNREVMALTLELDQRMEELRAAEHRYRRLAENAPDIIFRYDLRPRRLTFINASITTLTGYTPEDHYADPDLVLRMIHPEDRSLAESVFRGEARHDSALTLRWLRKDGTVIWVEQRQAFVLDEDGRLIAIECIARDITERRRLEEQLRQAQKMEAVGLLAGGIAHDFNNLLTVILGYANMLQRPFTGEDAIRDMAVKIQRASEQAALLTGQLLAFSRKQSAQVRVIDVNHILNEMTDMIRRLAGEDILLEIRTTPLPVHIKGDAGQLSQVLMNLVANARDAMPLGGKLLIETGTSARAEQELIPEGASAVADFVTLTITDNGSGMDTETRTRIFEPFFTTKEAGKGTGLGLATVHGIVHNHGGRIEVSSTPGQGTQFTIHLPQTSEEPAHGPVSSSTPVASRTATILVVEDQAPIRMLVEDVLSSAGHNVLSAGDGKSALQLAEEQRAKIDLLVTDVVMPEMSGPELATRLARRFPDLIVLYVSGYTDHALFHGGMMEHGTAFLHKPFLPQTLSRKIAELLASSGR